MAPEFAEFHDELRSVAGDLLAKDRAVDWSSLVDAGRAAGLEVRAEGFADRAYEADGSLCDRRKPGAILAPRAAAAQAVAIARERSVPIAHGRRVAIDADTICLHGDGPDALATAVAVRAALVAAGIDVAAP